MKKSFVDPETGWAVTQEPTESQTGAEVIQETNHPTGPRSEKSGYRVPAHCPA
jgi:hypothetical protein